jgi:flagellar biosynthesis/type III secretory pathway protein FliH
VGDFVSLADVLRAPAPAGVPVPDAPPPALEPPAAQRGAEPERPPTDERTHVELVAMLRETRLFRARLADAFDDARSRLVRELAAGVLARELRLAPCDLDALVQRVLIDAPVVRVRAAPCDVAAIRGVPVVADPELTAGDAVVELAGGALDARLGVRLALVLEAFA